LFDLRKKTIEMREEDEDKWYEPYLSNGDLTYLGAVAALASAVVMIGRCAVRLL